jgi:glycosyltransferase involved in cell wall biosynthesis
MDFSKCTSANYSLKVFGSDISDYLIKRREIFIKLLNHAKVIISPSRFTKGIYQSVFSEKVKVISHGIKEIEISKNQELTNSFGYIGSFLPQKGISLLLDAFDIYRQNGGKFELKLFGGNLDNNLNNIDGLSQYGVYNTSDLPKICSKFDIGIIPSIFPESFCLTLSELWSMKKPVICSSIGALKERIFDNPKGGILFGITNVNNLVEALFMAEKNSAKFVNEFSAQTDSLEKMANTYREIYVS